MKTTTATLEGGFLVWFDSKYRHMDKVTEKTPEHIRVNVWPGYEKCYVIVKEVGNSLEIELLNKTP